MHQRWQDPRLAHDNGTRSGKHGQRNKVRGAMSGEHGQGNKARRTRLGKVKETRSREQGQRNIQDKGDQGQGTIVREP
jgi:hypothetical protein